MDAAARVGESDRHRSSTDIQAQDRAAESRVIIGERCP